MTQQLPHPAPGTPVAIGLGTNVGDRAGNLARAINRIGAVVSELRASTVWASDAMLLPGAPADWAMPFLNAVVVGRTLIRPHALLDRLQRIERDMGRGPHEKWAPRSIDLDLLLYGDAHIDDARLTVPHRGIGERPFVLLPLAELWPGRCLPGVRHTLAAQASSYLDRHPDGLPFHARAVDADVPLPASA